ncbi:MAG: hypothetical protein WBG92_17875, partial [Thiohalocapsa sp.]
GRDNGISDSYQGDRSDSPSLPAQRSRYRFRDDPGLRDQGRVDRHGAYRFRPLTAKELERRRDAVDDGGFRQRRPRSRQQDTGSFGGEAFGFEPDGGTSDFYQRYYRGGP